ncbi:ras and Rab interactor 2 isoform X4 [Nycticebus coucang]|uniref:ras and Rab interactor 2 isoform X4 n=1 Tax=Nycticebus coucang TaxID=9470 RepID=UPI00234C8783|nr:ras and Rab interactor 2 isoform X4 [Nycticebus coucang]
MSAWTMGARGLDTRGSFFKLIDTIASEIGELKQEMVRTDVSLENGLEPVETHSMVRHNDSGCSEDEDGKLCPRDSGYDSLSSRLSVLDRLLHTHPVWLQLGLSEEEAAEVLQPQPPGLFLVHKSTKMQKKVLSLRLPQEFGTSLKEFAIKESAYTFSLEGSGISFADLFRLIAFYCISRDVLPFTLKLPYAISTAKTEAKLEELAQLGLMHSQDLGGGLKRPSTRTPNANGTEPPRSPPPRPPPPAINSPHTSPGLSGAGAQAGMPETANHNKHGNAALPGARPAPVPPPRLKKQASFLEAEGGAKTLTGGRPGAAGRAGAAPPAAAPGGCTSAPPPGADSRPPRHGGRQRLSDMSLSTSSSDSLECERSMPLLGYEADTNSSLEDYEGDSDQETMAPPVKSKKKRSSSFVLPKLVKSQLQKVSGVFSSFMTPEKRMVRRIAELSRDKCTYFGCLVQDYVSFLQENRDCHVSSTDLLQTIRQFMTQVKNYLSQSSELDPPIESLIPEDQIDVVLEKAMHKCILKPLKGHVEAMLKDFHVADGSWKQLKDNLQLVRQRNPQELGVFAPTPDFVDVEKIKVKFMTMQKMYSPEKKVMLLLRVCKLIYTVMESNSGRMYGADDFLPVLTYVIAQCDMLELDTEVEYMMELLDPSLLHGEGGYYLTSAYGALSLIKNFQEEQAARLLSSETRDTLRQWHKRRTASRTVPSVDDFQNYLRVAFQEVGSGCTGKTLLVRPYVTTEDVCQICAEKFKVQDPAGYSLFLFVDETWQQLAEDTYPQKIKAELHSRPQPHIFHFVYKRVRSDSYGVIFHSEDEDLTAS